jgi:GT2 family glycosyltransferase
MLVRREAFDAVGGFDERFFLYWEDADLCRRLRDAGWRTVYHPGAAVDHVTGRSSRHAPAASLRAFHDSVFRYFLQHTRAPGRWAAPLVWLALRLRLALKLSRHESD